MLNFTAFLKELDLGILILAVALYFGVLTAFWDNFSKQKRIMLVAIFVMALSQVMLTKMNAPIELRRLVSISINGVCLLSVVDDYLNQLKF